MGGWKALINHSLYHIFILFSWLNRCLAILVNKYLHIIKTQQEYMKKNLFQEKVLRNHRKEIINRTNE